MEDSDAAILLALADPEQRRVAAMVRAAALEERAPLELRMAIERRHASHRTGRRRGWGVALGGATALAAALVVLVLAGEEGGPPSLAAVAALATRAPAAAATAPLPSVDGVTFPDWRRTRGWRATGVRTDRVGGRRAVTVMYVKEGRRVAYTILEGASPTWSTTRAKLLRSDGRTVVTWRRDGRACVVSSTALAPSKLLALATPPRK